MSRYTVIDPDSLPELTVIELPDSEIMIRDRMFRFKEVWMQHDPPLGAAYDVENTEFDPIRINQESNSYFETLLRNRINQAARAVTLAYATGTDLDVIASRYPGGVPRLPGEDDERYRRRILLSPATLSPRGVEEAYVYWALTGDATLRDASVTTVEGTGEITITLLNKGEWNPDIEVRTTSRDKVIATLIAAPYEPRPSPEQIVNAHEYVHALGRKSATDVVSIGRPLVRNVTLVADYWLFPGPDAMIEARLMIENVSRMLDQHRWLGYDLTHNAIHAAMKTQGVQNAIIREPAESLFAGPDGYINVTRVELRMQGRAE